MAKSAGLKVFVIGEVLRASHLNQLTEDLGAVGFLAPYNAALSKDSSGVVYLGTTAYSLAGIVFKTGYKLLETADGVNTTEITLSGGGGGSALANIEMKSQQEKLGNTVNISEQFYINEPYVNKDRFSMRLGKSYGTGDGTLMYLHPGYGAISKCNAVNDGTGQWSSLGAQAGTATAGGTTYIEGNSAIFTSVAATTGENGLRYKIGTSAISLANYKCRFAAYLNTLSNISSITAKMAGAAGTANSNSWNLISQASGSSLIAGWNMMEVNLAGTASATVGSFSSSDVKELHVLVTPTSSQAFVLAVDDVCFVSNKELWLPDVYQIGDASGTQLLHVASGRNGCYQLGTTILKNYAIESTDIRNKFGEIVSGNKMIFPSGTTQLSGDAAKQLWCINTRHFQEPYTNKTLSVSSRTSSPEYEIIDVPSSSQLKIKTIYGTGDMNSFVAGGGIIVHGRKWNGASYDPIYVSGWAANYKEFTLSGSSSISGNELTINHTGNNTGVDANGEYYVVSVVKEAYYRCENNNQGQSLQKLTFDEFKSLQTNDLIFSDDFNRANGEAGNSWTRTDEGSGDANAYAFKIVSNKLYSTQSGSYTAVGRLTRNLETYNISRTPFTVRFNAVWGTTINSSTLAFRMCAGSNGVTATGGDGCGIFWGTSATNILNKLSIIKNGSDLIAYTGITYVIGTVYEFEITWEPNRIIVRVWVQGQTRPSLPTISYDTTFENDGPFLNLFASLASNVNHSLSIDDMVITNAGNGQIMKGAVTAQSGQKLTLATKLNIQDTILQQGNVWDLETDAVLS